MPRICLTNVYHVMNNTIVKVCNHDIAIFYIERENSKKLYYIYLKYVEQRTLI